MYLQAIALVCLAIVQPFFCYEEKNRNSDVIFEYLGIDRKSAMRTSTLMGRYTKNPRVKRAPELVPLKKVDVSKMHKRDLQQGIAITFRAIDEEISLWLQPRDSMLASDETPVYHARYAPGYPNGVYFEEIINAMKDVRQLLEDPLHYASVVLGTDESGKTTVNGHLRSPRNKARLVISSLPDHIVQGLFSDRTPFDDPNDHSANLTYHIVVEINEDDDLQNIAGLNVTKLKTMSSNSKAEGNARATNNQNVDTLYLQILVQIDSTYNKQWSGKSLSLSLEYILSFWNGVDLIYRQIENPKIRFNIAGIVIGAETRVTSFLWNNTLEAGVSYDLPNVIREAMSYYYWVDKKTPMVKFDAVAVMTRMSGVLSLPPTRVSGISAGIGTICWRDDVAIQHGGVVLVTDNGAHSGVHTAAHEIGHILGAHHDEQALTLNCTSTTDGSIMARHTINATNSARFSSCNLAEIRKEFENGELGCLYNVPALTGTRLPGLMPGKITNIVEQCTARGYGQTCLPNGTYVDVCSKLWCSSTDDPNNCKGMVYGASAGSRCLMDNLTEYGICLKNRCFSV